MVRMSKISTHIHTQDDVVENCKSYCRGRPSLDE